MRRNGGFHVGPGFLTLVVGGLVLTAPMVVRADRLRLRGGGEIRGRVVHDPAQPDKVLVQTGTLSEPIVLERERIAEITEEPDEALDEYHARKDEIPQTAQAQYDFGLWCDRNRLPALAEVHYRRATAIDKDFAPARIKLGQTLYNGMWMSFDELREAQGLVKYRGRWISTQERDQIEAHSAKKSEIESWTRQIQTLARNLYAGNSEQSEAASMQLDAIRDPHAIPALVAMFGDGDDAQRGRLVRLLDTFPGQEARDALIDLLLAESEPTIRQMAITALGRRVDPDVSAQLMNRLRSPDPILVGSAARVLADLRVLTAVPRLVPLLVHTETKMMLVPSGTPNNSVTTFTSSTDFGTVAGPVAAPGAAAFGGTGVPLFSGSSLSMGNSQSLPSTVRFVTFVHRNADVLSALNTLTGQDFGYDITSWQYWLSTEFRAQDTPVRRVRQP